MNKLSIAVLLFSSLYLATALSDAPWAPLARGVYETSPFTIGLTDIGGQNNLGQAFDSGLFNVTQGEVGQVLAAWYQNDDRGFTYIAEPQLVLADGSLHSSKYAIRVDPENNTRTVVWWSLQQLFEVNFLPTGRNITWDADTGAVTVTTFEGINQFLRYQGIPSSDNSDNNDVDTTNNTDVVVDPANNTDVVVNPANNTDVLVNTTNTDDADVVVTATNDTDAAGTSSEPNVRVYDTVGEYLRDVVGYQPQDTGIYAQDEFLNNAVTNGISQVAGAANLTNLVLTNLSTLDTLPGQGDNTWIRLTGDVISDTDVGNLVAVVLCNTGGNCADASLQYWWWNSVLLA